MKEKNYGCVLCGAEIVYLTAPEELKCECCKKTFFAEARCKAKHFVCDSCHQAGPNDFIENFCRNTSLHNPWEISSRIMKNPVVKMHGPEHHFLVPAALLAAYYNVINRPAEKEKKIKNARQRAEKVPGGYCGTHGTCGAAIGTGIFISLVLEATPLSEKEWHLSNLMTSKSLYTVSMSGGPRCCKRDTFLTIHEAVMFTQQKLGVEIPLSGGIKCQFSYMNKECRTTACDYYPEKLQ